MDMRKDPEYFWLVTHSKKNIPWSQDMRQILWQKEKYPRAVSQDYLV